MTAERNIQYRYRVETSYGLFTDAIYFAEDAPWTQEQIDAEIERRVAAFVYAIENPPPSAEEPTVEEQLFTAEQQLTDLENLVANLGEQIG